MNQRKPIEIIFQIFNMQECKPVNIPIPLGVIYLIKLYPMKKEEVEDTHSVPYVKVL